MERWGGHRVKTIAGRRSTPQAAAELDATPTLLHDTELLVRVEILHLGSTSAANLERRGSGDVGAHVMDIVRQRGKMHNAETDSGGVLVGRVVRCGAGRAKQLATGTRIIPLCSLTAIPLHLERVLRVDGHQVWVEGHAMLYESLIVAVVPDDTSLALEAQLSAVVVSRIVPVTARAVLSALAARTATEDDPYTIAVLGCGRSGLLALSLCAELAPTAVLIALDICNANLGAVASLALPQTRIESVDATDPLSVPEAVRRHNSRGADVVLNLVSVPNTEAGSALACRLHGTIVYFSLATSFARAIFSTDVTGKSCRARACCPPADSALDRESAACRHWRGRL